MSLTKLNARDVAKDFGMQAKAITTILSGYTKETVSVTKILTDRELNIIFEHLTQHNQVDSIESIYADVYHDPAKAEEPAPAPKEEQPKKSAKKDGKAAAPAPAKKEGKDSAPAPAAPAAPAAQGQKEQPKQAKPAQPKRTPEKKVVDTRKGGKVNLE